MNYSGIYKIESKLEPDRCYIGSAINIGRRWNTHLRDLKNGVHHSIKLQRHCDKYGRGDLMFSIINECDKSKLLKTEQTYIDLLIPYFNNCMTAGSQLGAKRSDEFRERLREVNTGKKHSEETKKKMSNSRMGRISGMKGKHLTPEHKKKLSITRIGKITHEWADESRKKASESHKGITFSEERKQGMRKPHKKICDDKTLQNLYGLL
jgi:group I intron endonuclease